MTCIVQPTCSQRWQGGLQLFRHLPLISTLDYERWQGGLQLFGHLPLISTLDYESIVKFAYHCQSHIGMSSLFFIFSFVLLTHQTLIHYLCDITFQAKRERKYKGGTRKWYEFEVIHLLVTSLAQNVNKFGRTLKISRNIEKYTLVKLLWSKIYISIGPHNLIYLAIAI